MGREAGALLETAALVILGKELLILAGSLDQPDTLSCAESPLSVCMSYLWLDWGSLTNWSLPSPLDSDPREGYPEVRVRLSFSNFQHNQSSTGNFARRERSVPGKRVILMKISFELKNV